MLSTRTLYWIPYLMLCLAVPASAGGPLERISRLEQQVGDLHQLQRDVVPLIDRIDERLAALERRSAGTADLESEVASLRNKVSELTRQQDLAGRQRAALEAELRTLRRALDSQPRGSRSASPVTTADPRIRSAPRAMLFRGEYAPRSPASSVRRAATPSRRIAPNAPEYWKNLREQAEQELLASRRRHGLSHW